MKRLGSVFLLLVVLALTVACSKDSDDNKAQSASDYPNGCLSGVFSVSEAQTVRFSQGNLQYSNEGTHRCADGTVKPGTWRFAEHQYDCVGSESQYDGSINVFRGNVAGGDNAYVSSSYTGWVDLFGWGTSGYHDESDINNVYYYPYSKTNVGDVVDYLYNEFGYGPSYNMADSSLIGSSANYDWGVYNAISNGGDVAGRWRTLTGEEWDYLINGRTDAADKWGCATVNGVHGLVMLPDNWSLPSGSVFTPGFGEEWATNSYTVTQWEAMEQAGALFLPAAGYWGGLSFRRIGSMCYYWSSSAYDCSRANAMNADSEVFNVFQYNRYYGYSVRLVCE